MIHEVLDLRLAVDDELARVVKGMESGVDGAGRTEVVLKRDGTAPKPTGEEGGEAGAPAPREVDDSVDGGSVSGGKGLHHRKRVLELHLVAEQGGDGGSYGNGGEEATDGIRRNRTADEIADFVDEFSQPHRRPRFLNRPRCVVDQRFLFADASENGTEIVEMPQNDVDDSHNLLPSEDACCIGEDVVIVVIENAIDDDEFRDRKVVETDDGVKWATFQDVIPDDADGEVVKAVSGKVRHHRPKQRRVFPFFRCSDVALDDGDEVRRHFVVGSDQRHDGVLEGGRGHSNEGVDGILHRRKRDGRGKLFTRT